MTKITLAVFEPESGSSDVKGVLDVQNSRGGQLGPCHPRYLSQRSP
jgi:hypothetical protein